MRLINKVFVLSIFTILAISCSNNKPSDYTTLKQKALEIPPDFLLEPPIEGEGEGEEEVVNLPELNEIEDIQTILEDSTLGETSSDATVNKDMNLEEFVEENFLSNKKDEQEDEVGAKVNEIALANEAEKAREELLEIISANNEEEEEIGVVEEEVVAQENTEATNEGESDEMNEEVSEDFSEEVFLDELADTADITSLPEEEQLQPMILEDMPADNTDFGDEDLNDLLDRVDDLLNSYSN